MLYSIVLLYPRNLADIPAQPQKNSAFDALATGIRPVAYFCGVISLFRPCGQLIDISTQRHALKLPILGNDARWQTVPGPHRGLQIDFGVGNDGEPITLKQQ